MAGATYSRVQALIVKLLKRMAELVSQSDNKQTRQLRPFHIGMKVIPTLKLFRLYSLGLVLPVDPAGILWL